MPENEKSKLAYAISLVGQLGFNIVLPIIIAGWIGRYLDQRIFAGKYILTLIFPLFGGIFAIWYVYRLIMPLIDKESPRDKTKGQKNK